MINNELIKSILQAVKSSSSTDSDVPVGIDFEIRRTFNGWQIVPLNVLTALYLDGENSAISLCTPEDTEYSTDAFDYQLNQQGDVIKTQTTVECKWIIEF